MSDLREELGLLNPEQMEIKLDEEKTKLLNAAPLMIETLIDTYNRCGHNLCLEHRTKVYTAIKEAGYENLITK
jgi:hypothetical protein